MVRQDCLGFLFVMAGSSCPLFRCPSCHAQLPVTFLASLGDTRYDYYAMMITIRKVREIICIGSH